MNGRAKKQIVLIHGGDTFETYEEYLAFLKSFELDIGRLSKRGWKDGLASVLGNEYDVIAPAMPNKSNAKYREWKIWFEKIIPFLNDGVIFVGHSLGGTFLVKFLSENRFPKKIRATFLVAPPYDALDSDYTLADFIVPDRLELLQEQGGDIFLYHSKDDVVVPFADLEKYRNALPEARVSVFNDRGHFNQEVFPELVSAIQGLLKAAP